MATNASTPWLGGNPYIFTSGFNTPYIIRGNHKIQRLYWFQPVIDTSGVFIYSSDNSGMIYSQLRGEVSGQSQQLNLGDQWWINPKIDCVGSGTLYIYLDD